MFRKVMIAISLASLWGFSALADDKVSTVPDISPKCVGPFGLCGYVDAAKWKADKTLSYVIAPTYEKASVFRGDLASVRIDGKWGYINRDNKVVIKPKFDLVGRFDDGLAEVLIGKKVGVIRRNGTFAVNPQFSRAVPISDSIVLVKKGEWISRHIVGRDKFESFHVGLSVFKGQLYHLKEGWLTEDVMTFKPFASNDQNTVWAKLSRRNTANASRPLWGLMKLDGGWAVKPRFDHVSSLSEGLAVVSTPNVVSIPNKDTRYSNYGALNAKGEITIPLEFDFISGWRAGGGGLSMVRKGKKRGALDRQGTLIGGRYFDDYAYPYNDQQQTAVLEGGTWLSIASDGTLSPEIGSIDFTCEGDLSLKRYAKTVEFIKANGDRVGDMAFEKTYIPEKACGKPFWVKSGDKQGYIMPDGTILGGTLNLEKSYGFMDGVAAVKIAGKWGLIQASGEYRISPQYDELQPYGDGVYKVKSGEIVSYLTNEGELISKPELPVKTKAAYITCGGGARLVQGNGKWGMVDKDGETLVPLTHPLMSCFRGGVAWVPNDAQGAWCPIGPTGKRHKTIACKTTYYPYYQTHSFPERFDQDPYKSSVLWTKAYYEYGAGLQDTLPRMLPEHLRGRTAEDIAKLSVKDLRIGTSSIH